MWLEGRKLAVELADRRSHQGLFRKVAGVADEIARGEIVTAVGDEVVARDEFERVVRRDPMWMLHDVDMRVEALHRLARARRLADADPCRGVDDLALQVGERHR